jgi:hypothetical protein
MKAGLPSTLVKLEFVDYSRLAEPRDPISGARSSRKDGAQDRETGTVQWGNRH